MLMALTSCSLSFSGNPKSPLLWQEIRISTWISRSQQHKGLYDGRVFQKWLANIDKTMKVRSHLKTKTYYSHIVLSQIKSRHIVLLIDNAPSHMTNGITLTNVKFQLLPPRTTTMIQSIDAVFIVAYKRRFAVTICRMRSPVTSIGRVLYLQSQPTYFLALVGGCLKRDFKNHYCQLL